MLGNKKISDI